MRYIVLVAAMAIGTMFAFQGVAMADDVVINPHLTTDRSVDTATVQSMVASLTRPEMSDQAKALAIYHYIRRTMFHYRSHTRYGGGGATNLINGVGYCLCTPTAGAQVELLEAAGLKAAIQSAPGHGSVSAHFDGEWRWMDAFMGGCVWDKDRKSLASMTAVFEDPSLMKRENPSPVDLFPCRDVLYADALRFEPDNTKYHESCAPDDLAWMARSKPGGKSGSHWKSSMTLDITLRPGETYIREWGHQPGMFFLHNTQERFAPPHHFCGIEAEQRDSTNWPFFKPYVKEITSFCPKVNKEVTVKTGRYWANGTLRWSPDVTSLAAFSQAENVKVVDGRIVVAEPGRPGIVELTVKCPYMLMGGKLRGGKDLVDSKVGISIATDRNVGDRPAAKEQTKFVPLLLESDGGAVATADLRSHFAKEMGTRGYRLRFELANGAKLPAFEIETVFQHNMYALPQLMPGKNEVKVTVANPEALTKAKFVVEFAWDDPDGKPKTDRRVVDKSPFAFTIDIPDRSDLPRMRRVLLANMRPSKGD